MSSAYSITVSLFPSSSLNKLFTTRSHIGAAEPTLFYRYPTLPQKEVIKTIRKPSLDVIYLIIGFISLCSVRFSSFPSYSRITRLIGFIGQLTLGGFHIHFKANISDGFIIALLRIFHHPVLNCASMGALERVDS